jgi:hypothetical protein
MGLIGAARSGSAVSVAAALALLGSAPRLARAAEPSDLPRLAEPAAGPVDTASIPPADETPHALPPIQIHLRIARASEAEGVVTPEAKDIAEHVPAKYHSLSVLEDKTVSVLLGEEAHVALPDGRELVLLPIAVHGQQLHVQLEIPNVVNTSMRLSDNRAVYIGGVRMDPQHGDQGTLVFQLIPKFSDYVGEENQTLADGPTTPTAQPASSTTRR